MGKKRTHIIISVGINSHETREISQRAYLRVTVNRANYHIETIGASLVPPTHSHANHRREGDADHGEATSDSHKSTGVSQAAFSSRDTSTSAS